MTDRNRAWLEFIKSLMKPGYLYGINEDGVLYCFEVETPGAGESGRKKPGTQNITKESAGL